jgi:ubiquinone/menaquinone biosynthesis C-methylase UbiE
MHKRPEHLTAENAQAFQAVSVAERYQLRSPYPEELFSALLALIVDTPRTVLDAGAGTGDIARRIVLDVERVDAVDISPAMIEEGRNLPQGRHPRLSWILGSLEEAPLHPPYALVVAGESLHWMNWEQVLPRFSTVLTPQGMVAIAYRLEDATPWQSELDQLIQQYSVVRTFQTFDLIAELETRRLFEKVGEYTAPRRAITKSLDDYINSFHSRSSLSLDRMLTADAAEFDRRLRQILRPFSNDGNVALQISGSLVWGKPLSGEDH